MKPDSYFFGTGFGWSRRLGVRGRESSGPRSRSSRHALRRDAPTLVDALRAWLRTGTSLRNGVAVADAEVTEMSRKRPRNLNVGLGTTVRRDAPVLNRAFSGSTNVGASPRRAHLNDPRQPIGRPRPHSPSSTSQTARERRNLNEECRDLRTPRGIPLSFRVMPHSFYRVGDGECLVPSLSRLESTGNVTFPPLRVLRGGGMLCSPSSSPCEGWGTRYSLSFAAQEDGGMPQRLLESRHFSGEHGVPPASCVRDVLRSSSRRGRASPDRRRRPVRG